MTEFKCRYGVKHPPEYLSDRGQCCHLDYKVFAGGSTYRQVRKIWNWANYKWEDEK